MIRSTLVRSTLVASVALATAATPAIADGGSPPGGGSTCTSSVPFTSGEDGYAVYRIPAVVETSRGAIVAFAEGRESKSDAGSIDIVSRRSSDGGCTWSPISVVADQGDNTIGNPAPVIDPATGDLVLLSTRNAGTASESEILRGQVSAEDSRRVFVQRSRDGGRTFSPLREITASTKHADWRWYATGPGHAIALTKGAHRGRLVVPANHSVAPPSGSTDTGAEAKYYGSHSLYSDDHGQTWHIGYVDDTVADGINSNESTVAQLHDGRVYFNVRDQNGPAAGTRADAYSIDGGETLTGPFQMDTGLVGPVVQGSVLQVKGHGWPLLFSGPSNPAARAGMAVRVSDDDGATWENRYPVSADPAAYSDLIQLDNRTIGLLYETGATDMYASIRFLRTDIKDILR